jgi:hypothetical protein
MAGRVAWGIGLSSNPRTTKKKMNKNKKFNLSEKTQQLQSLILQKIQEENYQK